MSNVHKFTGRAQDYTIGRPSYSEKFIDYLYEYYIDKSSIIADIGCGTGKFTKQLLDKGNVVYGIEPNDDMLQIAIKELGNYRNFHPIKANAENTTLSNNLIDFITVAQAFHWFDTGKFKAECKHILKPEGKIALIWNTRDMDADFNKESFNIYKKYCPNFKGFGGGITEDDERIKSFFDDFVNINFDYPLLFTKDKFIKRSLSASYSLKEGDEHFEEYVTELETLFNKYNRNGIVTMQNYTAAYIGNI